MNISEALFKEHSKKQTDKIVRFIGHNRNNFSILLHSLFSPDIILHQRAAWVFSRCIEKYPDLISPYFGKLIGLLGKPYHSAVKRNILRSFQFIEIPVRYEGKLANLLFAAITSPAEPIAVKCFAMTVLSDICKKHPGLKNEFIAVIESQLPYATPGIKSRSCKIMKELARF